MARPEGIELFEFLSPHTDDARLVLLIGKYLAWIYEGVGHV
jgi:hypothetical protein